MRTERKETTYTTLGLGTAKEPRRKELNGPYNFGPLLRLRVEIQYTEHNIPKLGTTQYGK